MAGPKTYSRVSQRGEIMNKDTRPEVNGEEITLTENLRSVIVIDDKPGDTTVRPGRPEIPRFWPADVPYPPPEKQE
jgi:hypothetical protein